MGSERTVRNAMNVFRLAMPSRDLDESKTIYVDGLGCRLARRFFGEPFDHFAGQPEKHCTFFLRDPSNKLVEFKHCDRSRFMC